MNTVKVETIYPNLGKDPLPGITPNEAAVLFLKRTSRDPGQEQHVVQVASRTKPAAAGRGQQPG